jgi:transposase
MASTTKAPAKKTPASPNTSAPAPKKPRKPKQAAMPLAQKFALLEFIKQADPSATDSAVAEQASAQFGRKVLKVSVAQYRKEFGIASVPNAKPAQVLAYVETLKALLTEHGIDIPPLTVDAPSPDPQD